MNDRALGTAARIMVVDDEEGARDALQAVLEDQFEVVCVNSGKQALLAVEQAVFDLVLLDLNMPTMNGIETLRQIKTYNRSIVVIMVSATDRAHEAAAAIKAGADDYITKPFEPETLLALVERAIQERFLLREARLLRQEAARNNVVQPIIGRSKAIQQVFEMIAKVAQSTSSVLITGESGTGKELIARAIHHSSLRARKPFVAINCASIPAELIESELFGYEKGAFTGAAQRTIGKFEYAHGGTLFLDEVSTLKFELQAKLLRFLQEREFSKVGGHRTVRVDVRVVAATNSQLAAKVRGGDFREDLYFRLNVIPIDVPPLRQRRGDVPILADFFLERFNLLLHKKIPSITTEAMKVLEDYPWPGNIRELENLIERMVVLSSDEDPIAEKDLPFDLLFFEEDESSDIVRPGDERGLHQAREVFERQYIQKVLKTCGGNQTEAAAALKIHRNTLLNKIKTLKIKPHPLP